MDHHQKSKHTDDNDLICSNTTVTILLLSVWSKVEDRVRLEDRRLKPGPPALTSVRLSWHQVQQLFLTRQTTACEHTTHPGLWI